MKQTSFPSPLSSIFIYVVNSLLANPINGTDFHQIKPSWIIGNITAVFKLIVIPGGEKTFPAKKDFPSREGIVKSLPYEETILIA